MRAAADMTIRIVSRREFMGGAAAAGGSLILGFWLPGCSGEASPAPRDQESFQPNAFLAISPDGKVTVWLTKSEMGQSVLTALPMIVADELGARWEDVRVELANADKARYGSQGTGGSASLRTLWEPLRKAGAAARLMLTAAAAGSWSVPAEECQAAAGAVVHGPSGRRFPFGDLVGPASRLEVPKDLPLRDTADFKIVGQPTLRLDAPDKVFGRAVFGLDVRVPGMLFAVLAKSEVIGGSVKSFENADALKVPGVKHVVQVGESVAVVADNTWAALEGRRALKIEWNPGTNADLSTQAIEREWARAASAEGIRAWEEGDAAAAIGASARRVEAVYDLPFLAHAPMEPFNCTADVRKDSCEIWAPTQVPNNAFDEAVKITGLPPERVTLHVTLMGGGFGRRLQTVDTAEAVRVSKAIGAPVKVVYSREDDMRHDFYRPGSRHVLKAGLDASGRLMAWSHRVITPSIGAQFGWVPEGSLDEGAVSGAANLPYAIPNIWIDFVMANTPVPIGWWRSVYDSQTAFANECFLDEVASAAGEDPLAMRRRLLKGSLRHLGVLNLAAEKAGWGTPSPPGRHRGLAVHFSFGSWAADVAEVSVAPDGEVRVHRIVCAIDCGRAVNPLGVRAQVEGATVFGLTAALKGAITVKGGRVEQGNFDDYPMLRIHEMPQIETWIVPSDAPPSGAGEPPVPPVAPAVANAIFAATGKRLRRLPLTAESIRRA